MMRHGILLSLIPGLLAAQQTFDTITVEAQALRGGVYMLTGAVFVSFVCSVCFVISSPSA